MQMGGGGTVAGIATVDSNGRIQVVNKPITNTISNISFKCDVCGLMFSHLTLLNHHKRIHTQDGSDSNNEQITVVTQSQNIVQAQNIVNENGQSLGQIQIVATEALEPATSQALQQVAEQQQQQQVQQIIQQQQVRKIAYAYGAGELRFQTRILILTSCRCFTRRLIN